MVPVNGVNWTPRLVGLLLLVGLTAGAWAAHSNEAPFGQTTAAGPAAPTSLRVLDYGPTGHVPSGLVQVKVRFSRPVVTLGQDEQKAADGLLSITPMIRGRLAWHGPDLLVLETTQPLPDATTFEVRLAPTLTSFDGLKLGAPLVWRFETPRPSCEEMSLSSHVWLANDQPIAVRCTDVVNENQLAELTAIRIGAQEWPLRVGTWKSERAQVVAWFEDQAWSLRMSHFVVPQDLADRTYVLWPLRAWPAGADVQIIIKRGLRGNQGPLTSEQDRTWKRRVAPEPAAVDLECDSHLRIRFATPITERAWDDDVRIEPRVERAASSPVWKMIAATDSMPATWSAELALAAPGTRYVVTVPAGSLDIYGNRTRQDWQREVVCPIPGPTTAVELGRAWDERVGVFEARKPRTMLLRTAGVNEVRLGFAPIEPARLLSDPQLYWRLERWASPPEPDDEAPASAVEEPTFTSNRTLPVVIEPDQGMDRTILNLSELPRGQLVAVRADAPPVTGMSTGRALLQVSDMGLVGWLPRGKGIVQAVRLSTGLPWPDVSVRASVAGGPWQDWGRTDARGLLNSPAVPQSSDEKSRVLLFGQAGADGIVDAPTLYEAGDYFDFAAANQPGLLGEVVLDRALYAPGESVTFVGFAAQGQPDGETVALPAGTKLKVGLSDDKLAPPIEVQVDERGKFWGRFQLPSSAIGGWQTLAAWPAAAPSGDEEQASLRGASFRVATFRPLEVEVRTRMPQTVYGPGETPRLDVETRYLTGANVHLRSAVVARTCRPSHAQTDIKGWAVGLLGHSHRLPERDEFAVDAQGLASGRFHLDMPGLPLDVFRPTDCTAEVTVQDQSLRSESAQVEYLLHPSRVVLGLRATQADPSKRDLVVEAVALTWTGERRGARGVVMSLRDETTKRIVRSQRLDLPASGAPGKAVFTDLESGSYVVSAEGLDDSRPLRSEMIAWVHRPVEKSKPARVVHDDQDDLRIGHPEIAQVGRPITFDLHVPRRVRTGVLAVMRGSVRETRALSFREGRAQITLVPQDSWYPSATVRLAALVPGGTGEGQRVDPSAQTLFEESTLKVSDEHRRLQVKLEGPQEGGPGQEVSYAVNVRDGAGRPVPRAHLSAWAVDDGVLAIEKHEIPDLVQTMTFAADNSVLKVDSLQRTLAPFLEKELEEMGGTGSGYGRGMGGLGGRRARAPDVVASTPERSRFEITPLFLGDAAADAQGRAQVRFRLPDNLTRFRISVLASAPLQAEGPSVRFGKVESHLTVSQPLALHPLLPRFLRPGDSGEASVVLQNLGTRPGQAEVMLALEGDSLVLQAPAQQSVALAVGQERRVSFALRAQHVGTAQVHVSARLSGQARRTEDALRWPVDVVSEPEPLDVVAMSGVQVGRGVVSVPTQLPASALRDLDRGRWSVRLADSLEGDLDAVLSSLIKYPHRCAEQTASSLLPFLLFPNHELVRTRDAQARLEQAVARFRQLQIKAGGLGFWPGERHMDPFVTAWVALVLSRSQAAPAVAFLQELRATLRQALQSRAAQDWPLPERALAVLALGPDARGLPELLNPAPDFAPLATGLSALAELARAHDPAQAQATTRPWLSEAIARLPEHAQRLHASAPEAHGFPSGDHVMAELALSGALARLWPDHPARPKLARALAEHRRGGAFTNTLENALFLMFAEEQQRTAGTGTVAVSADRSVLLDGSPWPTPGHPIVASWPLTRLPPSLFVNASAPATGQFLIDARGEGELFYSVEVSMAVADPTAAHDHGLALTTRLRPLDGGEPSDEGMAAGSLVALDLTLRTRTRFENVVIDVPLPAGLEAVDTDSIAAGLGADSDVLAYRDLAYAHRELNRDRVLLFPRSVARGTSQHTIFLRALVPGDYVMPNARAELMYSPDVRGRSALTRVRVRPVAESTR